MISLDRLRTPPTLDSVVWVEGQILDGDHPDRVVVRIGAEVIEIPANRLFAEVAQILPDPSS